MPLRLFSAADCFRLFAAERAGNVFLTAGILCGKINKLFALHYTLTRGARSTVQTEQAMPLRRGAGPRMRQQMISSHLWDSCMFHRCFFMLTWGTDYLDEVCIGGGYRQPIRQKTGGICHEREP